MTKLALDALRQERTYPVVRKHARFRQAATSKSGGLSEATARLLVAQGASAVLGRSAFPRCLTVKR